MARTILHRNRWFSVSHEPDPATLDGGGWYEIDRPDSVMIVPVLTAGAYVMIHGVRRACGMVPLFEFPSGGVDPDEDLDAAAARELHEETGYRHGALVSVGFFLESPGLSRAKCHLFMAHDLEPGGAHLEPGENWLPVVMSRGQILRELANGGIRDGATLAAIALASIAGEGAKV